MDAENELNVESYIRWVEHKNRSPRTIQSYRESIAQLVDWLDGGNLMDATRDEVQDWLIHLQREHAATTAAVRFRSLRAFYNWAVAEEIIDRSPMARLSEPKPDDTPVPVVPDEDLQALIKHCEVGGRADFESVRDLAIIRMFCEPGSPRIAEMAGILLDDVNLGRRPGYEVMGKGRKVRWIPLGRKSCAALERYVRLRRKHGGAQLPQLWLGAKRTDVPLSSTGIQQMLERRAKAAGLKHIRAHQLRHSAAHAAKVAGMSEEDMEFLFGWSEGSRMVKRYGKSAQGERAQESARRLSVGDRL